MLTAIDSAFVASSIAVGPECVEDIPNDMLQNYGDCHAAFCHYEYNTFTHATTDLLGIWSCFIYSNDLMKALNKYVIIIFFLHNNNHKIYKLTHVLFFQFCQQHP